MFGIAESRSQAARPVAGGARATGVAGRAGRGRELIWAGTVGLVLADSSVVTLALPEILRRFQTTVVGVSWVLTAFNLVLALAVLPAAWLAARGTAASADRVWRVGVLGFGAASLLGALAQTVAVLIAARALQAVAGACVIAGAIELLAGSRGSHARAATAWGAAGLIGLAIGPAVGGLLTEVISWRAIFVAQVPVVLLAVAGARAAGTGDRAGAGRAAAAGAGVGVGTAVGGSDRSRLPARGDADRRLGALASRGGADRVGDAGCDDRGAPAAARRREQHRGDGGGSDLDRRWIGGTGTAARRRSRSGRSARRC